MQAWRGVAPGGLLPNPRNPHQQLSPGLRCWLAAVFLFGAAHSCFRSGVGLSLGRYRVSSPAFAPAAEKQVQCNALGFLNSCPSAETRQSAKLSGRAGLRGGPWGGWGGWEGCVPQRRGDAGVRGGVGGTHTAGFLGAVVAPGPAGGAERGWGRPWLGGGARSGGPGHPPGRRR